MQAPAETQGVDAARVPRSPAANDGRRRSPSGTVRKVQLGMAGLVALTFFSVTGGPFGQELIIKAGGARGAICGLLALTVIWSVPEALMTAELSSAFPEAAGFAAWSNAAFGPFAAWTDSWCSWVSGVVDNAVYPLLMLNYLEEVMAEGITDEPWERWTFLMGFTCALTYLCYRGLDLTGRGALLLAFFILMPFLTMAVLAIPIIEPSRWLVGRSDHDGTIRIRPWLNLLFWNVNYYDSASAFAGETSRTGWGPSMMYSMMLCTASGLIPMLAATGASPKKYSDYHNGSYVGIARKIGGTWLARWVVVAAACAYIGLFLSEMSSDAYQLMGMAERGLLPACLAHRSKKYGTPTYAILLSAIGVVALHSLNFETIIAVENLLYVVSMMIELSAWIKLRATRPDLKRTFQAPCGVAGLVFMVVPAMGLLVIIAVIQPIKVWAIAGGLAALGFFFYALVGRSRRSKHSPAYHVLGAEWASHSGIGAFCGWNDRLLDHPLALPEFAGDTFFTEEDHLLCSRVQRPHGDDAMTENLLHAAQSDAEAVISTR
ncbi:amino acid permease-domain-containing protein [Pelagophyceae sp. CCMP2097]|nr:amino acid permease-domain-containing protein [Pelagophyceae sp. CCMP2097]